MALLSQEAIMETIGPGGGEILLTLGRVLIFTKKHPEAELIRPGANVIMLHLLHRGLATSSTNFASKSRRFELF